MEVELGNVCTCGKENITSTFAGDDCYEINVASLRIGEDDDHHSSIYGIRCPECGKQFTFFLRKVK